MLDDYNEIEIQLPKPPSLNHFYSGKHWTSRSSKKVSYYSHIKKALDSIDSWTMDRFSIDVRYNCRYDVDNAIVCTKFLSDYLRNSGYVKDDTPKYFISQRTQYDATVEKEQFVVKIKCYGYKLKDNERGENNPGGIEPAVLQSSGKNSRSGKRNVRKPTSAKRTSSRKPRGGSDNNK